MKNPFTLFRAIASLSYQPSKVSGGSGDARTHAKKALLAKRTEEIRRHNRWLARERRESSSD